MYSGLYPGNRSPLLATPLRKLPIRAITPEGWIRKQLELEAAGFTGHLDQVSPWLNKTDNAWLTPDAKGKNGWEEVPYWLRGFGDLGYVLGDKRIIAEAKVWIDAVIASQAPDGYIGPRDNLKRNDGKPDIWPNMLMLNALQSYYEYSGDKRVIDCLTRYYKWELTIPDKDFLLSYWEPQRVGDNIASLYWLYNRTGDAMLLNVVKKLHHGGADWVDGVANWHGVNFAQAFREPAEYYELSHDKAHLNATETDYETMRGMYGQVPGGLYGADENARKGFVDARQATETCTMVEMMWSDEMLMELTGSSTWGDRCEDVAFNSLPASMTPDLKSLHYLTAPNLIAIDDRNHAPDIDNGGDMFLFNPYDYRCCQHNSGMGWPYYAEHLWMATADNGLAAVLFGPCTVHAQVGSGSPVTIHETTHYPFDEHVTFHVTPATPTAFPLRLRCPAWCQGAKLSLNGKPLKQPLIGGGGFISVERTWKAGDTLVLTLPMEVTELTWPAQGRGMSVQRGPLSYSLKIGEDVRRGPGGSDAWPTWAIGATTPWNFGLFHDGSYEVVKRPWPADDQPFTLASAPIELVTKGREIDGWQEDRLGMVGLMQPSPAATSEPVTPLTLVPMGAARLRISVFPVVTEDGKGTAWVAPPHGHKVLPTLASHCFSGDTVDAPSDGLQPSNSNDQSIPRFTWWDHKGTEEWIEYDLPKSATYSSADVYWFDDGPRGGCRVPASWKLLTFEGGAWQEVAGASGYGVEKDRYNHISFSTTHGQKWRIAVRLQDGFSGGVLQWKLG